MNGREVFGFVECCAYMAQAVSELSLFCLRAMGRRGENTTFLLGGMDGWIDDSSACTPMYATVWRERRERKCDEEVRQHSLSPCAAPANNKQVCAPYYLLTSRCKRARIGRGAPKEKKSSFPSRQEALLVRLIASLQTTPRKSARESRATLCRYLRRAQLTVTRERERTR